MAGDTDMSGRQQPKPYTNEWYTQNSSQSYQQPGYAQMQPPPRTSSPHFDILDWHPAYLSCQTYFLDHAQHEPGTQALCALINIRLPFQWRASPIYSSAPNAHGSNQEAQAGPSTQFPFNAFSRQGHSPTSRSGVQGQDQPVFVSLIPYVRRLVITGFDKPGILHGLFGDAWQAGITPLQDCERRNYLFAAKHGGWRSCKKQYDLNEEETVPFLKPLENVRPDELDAADKSWSSWLAMEDWMIGPRAPGDDSQRQDSAMRGGAGYQNDLPDSIPSQLGG